LGCTKIFFAARYARGNTDTAEQKKE